MVRTLSGGSRPAWYDRHPISKVQSYNGSDIAPHSATQRTTYTCPAGKKAIVELLALSIERVTVATTPLSAMAYVIIAPGGTGSNAILFARLEEVDNSLKDKDRAIAGSSIALNAGDILSSFTIDASTGGLISYNIGLKYTEFDA